MGLIYRRDDMGAISQGCWQGYRRLFKGTDKSWSAGEHDGVSILWSECKNHLENISIKMCTP